MNAERVHRLLSIVLASLLRANHVLAKCLGNADA
jgi:hypothetical protein